MRKTAAKISAFFGALTVCAVSLTAIAFASPVYSETISTSYKDKSTLERTFKSNGYEYGLAAYYNVGNSFNPFSNPSIAVKAGASSLKHRYVYAELTELTSGEKVTQKEENSHSLNGVKYIEVNAWKYGQYGKGFGEAKVYDGKTKTNMVGYLKIKVE